MKCPQQDGIRKTLPGSPASLSVCGVAEDRALGHGRHARKLGAVRAIEIRGFEAAMVGDAAALLAESWVGPVPALPADGKGFAAIGGGRLVGYLLSPEGSARIRLHEHAARGDRREVYRRLYAAHSLGAAAESHQIDMLVSDTVAVQTWFELGFGVDQIKGVRSLDTIDVQRFDIRRADPTDVEPLIRLMIELNEFHARAPMSNPDALSEEEARRLVVDDVARDGGAVWVAVDGPWLVGFMTSHADGTLPRVATIGAAMVEEARQGQGLGTALLARTVDWARETGYERCAVGWTSQSPTSDRFWRGHGFEPYRYTLRRVIQSRRVPPRV